MRVERVLNAAADIASALGPVRVGTPRPDVLAATADGQILLGLGGADRLTSAFDRTALFGGSGADELRTEVAREAPQEGSVEISAAQSGGAGDDTLTMALTARVFAGSARIAFLADGGGGDDVIDVSATFRSTFGEAELVGAIHGGAGDDRIRARVLAEAERIDGPLRVLGGSGNDTIDAVAENFADITGDASTWILGEGGDDTIAATAFARSIGPANVRNHVDGGSGADVISASTSIVLNNSRGEQSNHLYGGAGDDTLGATHTARSAFPEMVNHLDGGAGNDVLTVTQRTDGESADVEALRLDNRLVGGSGNDALEADIHVTVLSARVVNRLEGGAGDDVLVARITSDGPASGFETAQNLLHGGGGADRLIVIGGRDNILEGGSGVDTFVLDPDVGDEQTITLADFDGAADRLEFAALVDEGAPGLVDDLDAITSFAADGAGVLVARIGLLALRLPTAPAGVDSFADLVDDPASQLVAGDALIF